MEYWRNQLYHSELYHYGVKGMKWGKHKTPLYKYSDSYNGQIDKAVGMYTQSQKNNPYPHSLQVGYTRGKGGTQLYLHNTRNNTYMKSGETNTGRSKGAFKVGYAEDGARYSVNLSRIKSATVDRAKRKAISAYKRVSKTRLSAIKSFKASYNSGYKKKTGKRSSGSFGQDLKNSFMEGYNAGQARAKKRAGR